MFSLLRWGADTYLGCTLEDAFLWNGAYLPCWLVVFASDQPSRTGGICGVAGQVSRAIVNGVVVVPFVLLGSGTQLRFYFSVAWVASVVRIYSALIFCVHCCCIVWTLNVVLFERGNLARKTQLVRHTRVDCFNGLTRTTQAVHEELRLACDASREHKQLSERRWPGNFAGLHTTERRFLMRLLSHDDYHPHFFTPRVYMLTTLRGGSSSDWRLLATGLCIAMLIRS